MTLKRPLQDIFADLERAMANPPPSSLISIPHSQSMTSSSILVSTGGGGGGGAGNNNSNITNTQLRVSPNNTSADLVDLTRDIADEPADNKRRKLLQSNPPAIMPPPASSQSQSGSNSSPELPASWLHQQQLNQQLQQLANLQNRHQQQQQLPADSQQFSLPNNPYDMGLPPRINSTNSTSILNMDVFAATVASALQKLESEIKESEKRTLAKFDAYSDRFTKWENAANNNFGNVHKELRRLKGADDTNTQYISTLAEKLLALTESHSQVNDIVLQLPVLTQRIQTLETGVLINQNNLRVLESKSVDKGGFVAVVNKIDQEISEMREDTNSSLKKINHEFASLLSLQMERVNRLNEYMSGMQEALKELLTGAGVTVDTLFVSSARAEVPEAEVNVVKDPTTNSTSSSNSSTSNLVTVNGSDRDSGVFSLSPATIDTTTKIPKDTISTNSQPKPSEVFDQLFMETPPAAAASEPQQSTQQQPENPSAQAPSSKPAQNFSCATNSLAREYLSRTNSSNKVD